MPELLAHTFIVTPQLFLRYALYMTLSVVLPFFTKSEILAIADNYDLTGLNSNWIMHVYTK